MTAIRPRYALALVCCLLSSAGARATDPLPEGATLRLGTLRLRHTGAINGVAFSPDGKVLATAGDNTVRCWDVRDGSEVCRLKAEWTVKALAFSPDGKWLVSADRWVRLHDAATGKLIRSFKDKAYSASAVALSADGKLIAAGGSGRVFLWDAASGKALFEQRGHRHEVLVAFALGGKVLVSVGKDDGDIRCWEVASGKELRRWHGPGEWHQREISSLAASPDGKVLATGHTKVIRLWDAATGRQLGFLDGHGPPGQAESGGLAFSPDGKTLLSGGFDGTLRLWDVANGRQMKQYDGCDGWYQPVAFSPDGRHIVSGGQDGIVRLLRADTGAEVVPLSGHRERVHWATITPDGQTLITGGKDQTVRLWKSATGQERKRLEVKNYPGPRAGVLAPDGRTLAVADGSLVRFRDLASGDEVLKLVAGGEVTSLSLSRDGSRLAAGDSEGTARVWRTASGEESLTVRAHDRQPVAVALAADGTLLATVARGLRLWGAVDGKRRWEVRPKPGKNFLCVAFSPDAALLAAGDTDGGIHLFDPGTGKPLWQAESKRGLVRSLCFSPDGRLLASAHGPEREHEWHGGHGLVVWDATSGALLRTFGEDNPFTGATFTPDGRGLVSSGVDTTAVVWSLLPRGKAAPSATERKQLWEDLATKEPEKAYRAMWSLAAEPDVALALLAERVKPARRGDARNRQSERAVQVLELVGTPRAEKLLDALARGEEGAALSREARAALERLHERVRARPALVFRQKEGFGKGVRPLQDHAGEVTALAFSPDGKALASVGIDGKLMIGATTGRVLLERDAHRGKAFGVAYSPDGKRLATCGADRVVRLWDARGKEAGKCEGHADTVVAVTFSADGKVLASGGYDGKVFLWGMPSGKRLGTFRASQGVVTSLSFAPDGGAVAVGGTGQANQGGITMGVADRVALWEVPGGKKLRTFPGRGSVVAFSPDGRFVAGGGLVPDVQKDGRGVSLDGLDLIALWRAGTGEELHRIPWRGSALAVSPDGQFLVSGAGTHRHLSGNIIAYNGINGRNTETSLRLWEVATGQEVLRLAEADAAVVAFSPDGRTLAAGNSKGIVFAWDVLAQGRGSAGKADGPDDKELAALWDELASAEAARAFRARCALCLADTKAVVLLRKNLRAVPEPDGGRVARLVEQLGDRRFAVREAAAKELHRMGDVTEPHLRRALGGDLPLGVKKQIQEVLDDWQENKLSPEELRLQRAVWVLERAQTPAARELLEGLAKGASGARLTRLAKAALDRR